MYNSTQIVLVTLNSTFVSTVHCRGGNGEECTVYVLISLSDWSTLECSTLDVHDIPQ